MKKKPDKLSKAAEHKKPKKALEVSKNSPLKMEKIIEKPIEKTKTAEKTKDKKNEDIKKQKNIFICPLCNQEVDENVKDYHRNLEEWAINEILDANPDWSNSPDGQKKAEEFYRKVVLQKHSEG